jgi:aminoglycoside phosphotransferase (APT) family kinase protein
MQQRSALERSSISPPWRAISTSACPAPPAELEALQFPGGHSNLTYLIRRSGCEYVLRRPPLGPIPPRAHDMAREARVLQKLAPLYQPAPRVELICEDKSVLGRPFFLMERRRGIILRRTAPEGLGDPRKIADAFVERLAELHSIDIFRHGLDSIGKPEGFLERQVRGWSARWEAAQRRDSGYAAAEPHGCWSSCRPRSRPPSSTTITSSTT